MKIVEGRMRAAAVLFAMSIAAASIVDRPANGQCGTIIEDLNAALEMEAKRKAFEGIAQGSSGLTVQLTIHIVRQTNGLNGVHPSFVQDGIDAANEMFNPAGISFCWRGDPIYIDNDLYFNQIDSPAELDALRQTEVVPNTINLYYVQKMQPYGTELAGISSFTFSPVQGIVIDKFSGDLELTHQLAHYFDLFHIDETMFGAECTNGSNCQIAGDLLCDTPACPILTASNLDCCSPCIYDGNDAPPCEGDRPFWPYIDNVMTTPKDSCWETLTEGQLARALATLTTSRADVIGDCTVECPPQTPILYVRSDAPAGGDGSSWEAAIDDLAIALARTRCTNNIVEEIWVKGGLYLPDSGTGLRGRTFLVRGGLKLYGSFAGDETSIAQRDLQKNPTVLSGDLNGDDSENFVNRGDNSRIVMVVDPSNLQTVIDGFTFTAAESDGNTPGGTGLYAFQSNAHIRNCSFIDNRTILGKGGGLLLSHADGELAQSTFTNNLARSGGGASFKGALVHQCVFTNNVATDGSGAAEGSGTWSECEFAFNSGSSGGAFRGVNLSAVFNDCRFIENQSGIGGAIEASQIGSLQLNECLFVGNQAITGSNAAGGAIFLHLNPCSAVSCLFLGNSAKFGGAVRKHDGRFRGVNCTFSGNSATSDGGAIYGAWESPANPCCNDLVNCTFSQNSALGLGGGLHWTTSTLNITNSVFWNNTDSTGATSGAQIKFTGTGLTVFYSCVQGYTGPGAGNSALNPLLADPDGLDNVVGTLDDDLRLSPGSPCIDSGNNTVDINSFEAGAQPLPPVDALGLPRFVDDPDSLDVGVGTPPLVDRGAVEHRQTSCLGDLDASGSVDVDDLLALINVWGSCESPVPGACPSDVAPIGGGNGVVDSDDLVTLINHWGACPKR
jgi:hypothetical protein